MAEKTPNVPQAGERVAGNPFRVIPPVSDLCAEVTARGAALAEPLLTDLVRRELDRVRLEIRGGALPDRDAITEHVVASVLALLRPRLEPAINATGILIHTNLGRAPVSQAAARAMAAAAASAVPLEIDPASNQRGGRMAEISALMQALTGAEATLVVNNCAAAVLLVLSALAHGREVLVSRGEAIEIGGGFRIPDVLRQSGAHLVEVGTTNRTYPRDFDDATTAVTAAYLRVHPSNFRISGFTHSPATTDLVPLARRHDVFLLEDLGSGALLDTAQFGLAPEPTLREVIASGVDLAMASGDKLLGGPQAGLIVGRADLVRTVEHHPLARAVRADKVALAGVAETLRHYVRGEAEERVPVWRMISASADALQQRGASLVGVLNNGGVPADLVATQATVGGGSLPGETLASWAVRLRPATGEGADALATRLRAGAGEGIAQRVFGRVADESVLLDLRSVLPEHDAALAVAIENAFQPGP